MKEYHEVLFLIYIIKYYFSSQISALVLIFSAPAAKVLAFTSL